MRSLSRILHPNGYRLPLPTLLRLWQARRRSRIALSRLDTRLLDDCGLTAAEAKHEAATPCWRTNKGDGPTN